MGKRNPYVPPASDVSQPGARVVGKRSVAMRALIGGVTLWVVVSPILWWFNLSNRFGISPLADIIVQPAALALVSLFSFPFLWQFRRIAAIALLVGVGVLLVSMALLHAVLGDGVLVNAVLLVVMGLAVIHHSSGVRGSE